jgi:hypothetical protein
MSKGSNRRPDVSGKFNDNFDKIFGKKGSDPVNIDDLFRYEVHSRDDRRVVVSHFETLQAAREFIQFEVDSLWPNWNVNSHCIFYIKRETDGKA